MRQAFTSEDAYQHSHNAIERGDFVARLIWGSVSENLLGEIVNASVVNVLERVLPYCGEHRVNVACHAASALVWSSAELRIREIDAAIAALQPDDEVERMFHCPGPREIALLDQRDAIVARARGFAQDVFRATDNDWSDPRLTRGESIL